jgi:hypothetical protein
MKLTSADLLERLKIKGSRSPELTRQMIIEKLNDDDCEVATTTLKVSVACPLGKMRMQVSTVAAPTVKGKVNSASFFRFRADP